MCPCALSCYPLARAQAHTRTSLTAIVGARNIFVLPRLAGLKQIDDIVNMDSFLLPMRMLVVVAGVRVRVHARACACACAFAFARACASACACACAWSCACACAYACACACVCVWVVCVCVFLSSTSACAFFVCVSVKVIADKNIYFSKIILVILKIANFSWLHSRNFATPLLTYQWLIRGSNRNAPRVFAPFRRSKCVFVCLFFFPRICDVYANALKR